MNLSQSTALEKGMLCEICGQDSVAAKKFDHRILGPSDLLSCKACGHTAFSPVEAAKRKDSNFSIAYAKQQKHLDGILSTFKCRRYFIDFSRLMLLSHFKFLKDGTKILELGPGFPGLFQQMKLTSRKLEFFAVEAEAQSRKLLENYGIKLIGNYFPGEYSSYEKTFDVIFACNILYYFDHPIAALRQMLGLLKKDGVILIDILNNKILHEEYYKENTMVHIFSKISLQIAVEKAGGTCRFLDTCCVKEPDSAFDAIETNIFLKKVKNKLKLDTQQNVMKYFAQAPEMKYGDPEGHYIRAVVTKKA